ncbi:MAG TPA: hypothetical protein DEA63_04520 [Firmicutes bacterium]|nr:hypothetical protein [Bacillota bacterium]
MAEGDVYGFHEFAYSVKGLWRGKRQQVLHEAVKTSVFVTSGFNWKEQRGRFVIKYLRASR